MNKTIINMVMMTAMVFLLSCQEDAEFNIDHLQTPLEARFSTETTRVLANSEVKFTNASVGANGYTWIFEGGEPATSTDENPVVKYATEGNYKVSLTVTDGTKKHILENADFITVFADERWKDMVFPTINFTNTSADKTLYQEIVPDPEKLIHTACFDVARWLFISPEEMDVLNVIDYSVEDKDGISAKGGQAPHINIFFSATYLKQCKDKGMSNAELLDEIKGVLYHEVTHGYQFSPQGAGQYKQGDDFFGFIEGMADYVRYVSGYLTTADRAAGGHWNDGYKTSGFFMDWLHSKDQNFLNNLNKSAKTINPWSWEKATQQLIGKSVQELWSEYQDDMKTGKITEIDEKLVKMRNGEEVDFGGNTTGGTKVIDITNVNCVITTDASVKIPENESVEKLIDNNNGSKFLAFINKTWVQFSFEYTSVLTKYTLTSGNDAPERDPKNWSLKASNDGTTWVEIDSRTGESFTDRKGTNTYTFENTTTYKMYKFEFENTSGDIFQLGEIELFAEVGDDVNIGDASLVDITKQNPTVTVKKEAEAFYDWGVPAKAYDGDQGSFFFNHSNTSWLTFETAKKHNVKKVTLSASNQIWENNNHVFSVDRFTLLGSDDGATWTEITKVTNTGITAFSQKETFTFENTAFYKFHKIEVEADVEEKGRLVIAEMEIFGTAE